MVLIILAVLGVPLWIVFGVLATVLWSRSQVKKAPGVFPCKVRLASGTFPGLKEKWPFLPSYAAWVHDVLIVRSGLALVRSQLLPVADLAGEVEPADPQQIKRLGENPQTISLRLDNGAVVEAAAAAAHEDMMLKAFAPRVTQAASSAAAAKPA
jgi:hypothetical protein